MAVTPCFRNEPFDQWHSKYFMKLELFTLYDEADVPVEAHITKMVGVAKRVLEYVGGKSLEIEMTDQWKSDPTAIGPTFDLTYKGIEIGSYGARRCEFCSWIYGTGIAEPRFSKVTGA
jgi:hypothetical protein